MNDQNGKKKLAKLQNDLQKKRENSYTKTEEILWYLKAAYWITKIVAIYQILVYWNIDFIKISLKYTEIIIISNKCHHWMAYVIYCTIYIAG